MKKRRERSTRLRRKRGFTLIELMVTISVIALITAILVPVVSRVRETARDAQCKSNLRQFGQGLMQYATSSPSGDYCSGAWDWKRDGAVTEVGWVADLVNRGTPVGDLLCPSSPYHLSRVFRELLTLDGAANTCADSLGGTEQTLPDGTVVANPCRLIGAAVDKGRLLHDLLLEKKYNTNYAASWFLVRSEVIIDQRGKLVNRNAGCATGRRERSCTVGPLNTARVGGKVSATVVPLMACGGLAEMGENVLPEPIDEHGTEEFLADSYSSGPRDPNTLGDPAIASGAYGAQAWFGPWNNTLQDYRAFGPMHGGRNKASCNIVFLDGSVKSFLDENGDGLLNNGFPASTTTGFADDSIELPPAEIHSQWSLDPARLR